jgi:hypothetical protein
LDVVTIFLEGDVSTEIDIGVDDFEAQGLLLGDIQNFRCIPLFTAHQSNFLM